MISIQVVSHMPRLKCKENQLQDSGGEREKKSHVDEGASKPDRWNGGKRLSGSGSRKRGPNGRL